MRRLWIKVLFVIFLTSIALSAQCKVIYVTSWGVDTSTGESWTQPKGRIQAAIDIAAAGDEVWVARGTYSGEVVLKANVSVYGGFRGTETLRSERNWNTNTTIINAGTRYAVYTYSGVTQTTVIDGFTLQNSNSHGIYCNASSPTISHCIITQNQQQGIYCQSASPAIVNNLISANGGGIYCTGTSAPSIINNNLIINGEGVYCDSQSSLTMTNNIAVFNDCGVNKAPGGAIALRNNCVYGNKLNDFVGFATSPVGTDGNISADPKLVNIEYGHFQHIRLGSPCIDTGDDGAAVGSVDVDGDPRIIGEHVDIGVDESDGTDWPASPRIIRVSPGGKDTNDGSTWELAKKSIQGALSASAGGEIWVKAGTYPENIGLKSYVYLYGGFNGTETERSQRDWRTNVTTMDGHSAYSVVNAYRVSRYSTIDGFTIQNGKSATGGGIKCEYSSLTIANNIITNNVAPTTSSSGAVYYGYGGGIYCYYSSPRIINNIISGNSSPSGSGGGFMCSYSSSELVNNVIAGNCAANDGGGIYCVSSSLTLTANSIARNSAEKGGGIACEYGSSLTASNNIVCFNTDGGIWKPIDVSVVLRNNCIFGNSMQDFTGFATSPIGVNGNISVDPKINISNRYVHIQQDSPCIDAGDDGAVEASLLDIDGQTRLQGEHIDIGADESDGTEWPDVPVTVVRVSPDGDNTNSGDSWGTTKGTVQAAVDALALTGGEVWVKAGLYCERVTLCPNVHIYGGFAGTETDVSQRNRKFNVTTIDGQQFGTVVTIPQSSSGNTVDGFTITNGKGTNSGGIYCAGADAVITNNIISNNQHIPVSYKGTGGIYCYGFSPVIRDNVISQNVSASGSSPGDPDGGIYCYSSSALIEGNIIKANGNATSYIYTYGISCKQSSPVIRGNIIAGNALGGISCSDKSNPTIVNNTIVDHAGAQGQGAGISVGNGYQYSNVSSPSIYNNIIAFNSYGIVQYSSGLAFRRNNCVYGCYSNTASLLPAPTDIQVDPLFVNRQAGDYHLLPTSPCIDAGYEDSTLVKSLDIDGQKRPYGLRVDIGADEYAPWVATPVFYPDGGVYLSTPQVAITCATPGAVIHYTLDGSEPSENSPIVTGPLQIDTTLTLKARAFKTDWTPSAVKSASYTVDTTPASGISIESGAERTNKLPVTITVLGIDGAVGLSEMRFSSDASAWSDWEAYASTKPWILSSGDGIKKVYAEFRDSAGTVYSGCDAIILDTIEPYAYFDINDGGTYTNITSVVLTIYPACSAPTFEYTSPELKMRFTNDSSVWLDWETFNPQKGWTLTSGNGLKTVHMQMADAAGNVTTVSNRIVLDNQPPSGSIVINSGAASTLTRSVTLSITASDASSGVGQMRIRNETQPWSDWEVFASQKEWTLSYVNGIKTVSVQIKDNAGLTSSVISDTIRLGALPPSTPIITDNGIYSRGLDRLSASWSVSDTESGIAEYQFAIGRSLSDLIVNWKSAGDLTNVDYRALELVPNEKYYWFVKARNLNGDWSEVGSSDGIIAAVVVKVGEARKDYAGSAVYLSDLIVTSLPAELPGLWLQDYLSSAIKIPANWDVARGDSVRAAGIVSWVDGMPVLANPELKYKLRYHNFPPLGSSNLFLANDPQERLQYAGLNPVGMLVSTWGRVTQVDTGSRVFYIDDGAGLTDGMAGSEGAFVGLRVAYGEGITPPSKGSFVKVTGIRTVKKVTLSQDTFVNGSPRSAGETLYLPELSLRGQLDLAVLTTGGF